MEDESRNTAGQALGKPRARITRRHFLGALAGGTAAVALAACTQSPVSLPGSQPKLSTKEIKFKFYHMEPDPKSVKKVEDMGVEFKQKYPNMTMVPSVFGWADLETKTLAALAAGSPPEIADTFVQHVGWAAARGLLRPLDDVYEAVKQRSGWYEELIEWVRYDGHVWALPWTWGTDMLLIRKDLSDKAGLKEPDSWDDWFEWGKALTKPPDQFGIHLAGNSALWFNEDVFEFLGQNGGLLWDDDGLPAIESAEMNDVLEYYKKITAAMPPGWLADGYTETMNTMALGKAISARLWGRAIGYIEQYAPADKQNPETYKMIMMPHGPKSQKRTAQADDDVLVIYKGSAYAEEAAEFLKTTLYKHENVRDFCLSVPIHLLPPVKGVTDDPIYKNNPVIKKWKNWDDVQWKTLETKNGQPLFMTRDQDKKVAFGTDLANSGILGEMVTAVVSKGVNPKDAMKTAQTKALKLIAEVGPSIPKKK